MDYRVQPSTGLHGTLKVAGDKSISHRCVILGAIAEGKTRISGMLEGHDVLATIAAFQQMGVSIDRSQDEQGGGTYTVEGCGLHGLRAPSAPLDMGNSGTAFRLLAGLLCGQKWPSTLTGDASLTGRPMGRIIDPLQSMGARIESREGYPPITVLPAETLSGIDYRTPMASAQVKSAVLLAGLYASGSTTVTEPASTRDHTERMLRGFGYPVEIQGRSVTLSGGQSLQGQDISVPADLSSAAFFLVAALISSNSSLTLTRVGNNPSRNGVIGILQRMGANLELTNQQVIGGEPVADITASSSVLEGCDIAEADVSSAIDEIPVIAIAAACASGVTRISGASELRVKESDRISSVVAGLRALGIEVEEHNDGMTIHGSAFDGGTIDSMGDHRIAMAFAVAGVAARNEVTVVNCDNVATSFPDFTDLAAKAGVDINVRK